MKAPHWWQVMEGPEAFAEVFVAARELGLRLGWLELDRAVELEGPLAAAAGLGAMRAVAVGGGRSVAVKPLRGTAVPADLLREHFLGCAAVLVRGASSQASAELSRESDGYRLRAVAPQASAPAAQGSTLLTAEQVAGRLRKAHPEEPS